MKIVLVSGSTRKESTNALLLSSIPFLTPDIDFEFSELPGELPLFRAELDASPLPKKVVEWRDQLKSADGLILCTPEYLQNMPALIKNALEWVTTSGELNGRKVLAITLTPHEPRGEKAMTSLLWTLKALEANVVAHLPLYLSEIAYDENGRLRGETSELLKEALDLFI